VADENTPNSDNARTRTSALAKARIALEKKIQVSNAFHIPKASEAVSATLEVLGLDFDGASTDESRALDAAPRIPLYKVIRYHSGLFGTEAEKHHYRRRRSITTVVSCRGFERIWSRTNSPSIVGALTVMAQITPTKALSFAPPRTKSSSPTRSVPHAASRLSIATASVRASTVPMVDPHLSPPHDVPIIVNLLKATHASMNVLNMAQIILCLEGFVGHRVSRTTATKFMESVKHEFKDTSTRSIKPVEALRATSLTASSITKFFESVDFHAAIDDFLLGAPVTCQGCKGCRNPATVACRECGLRCRFCALASHHPENPTSVGHDDWLLPRSVDAIFHICWDETSGTHTTKKHGGRPVKLFSPRDSVATISTPIKATSSPVTFIEFVVVKKTLRSDGTVVMDPLEIDAITPYIIVATKTVDEEVENMRRSHSFGLGSVKDTAHITIDEFLNVHHHLVTSMARHTTTRSFTHIHIDGPSCHMNLTALQHALENQMMYHFCVANGTSCLQVCDDEAIFGIIKSKYHAILEMSTTASINTSAQIRAYLEARLQCTMVHRLRAWSRVGMFPTDGMTRGDLIRRREEILRRNADQNNLTPVGVEAVKHHLHAAGVDPLLPAVVRCMESLTALCEETREYRRQAAAKQAKKLKRFPVSGQPITKQTLAAIQQLQQQQQQTNPQGQQQGEQQGEQQGQQTQQQSPSGDAAAAAAPAPRSDGTRSGRVCRNCGQPGHYQKSCKAVGVVQVQAPGLATATQAPGNTAGPASANLPGVADDDDNGDAENAGENTDDDDDDDDDSDSDDDSDDDDDDDEDDDEGHENQANARNLRRSRNIRRYCDEIWLQ
jgi:hypothetical protein